MASRVLSSAAVAPPRHLPFRPLIPYYGGKSKLSLLYSPPRYDRIVEPFAGGASYSLRHYDRDVWVNDLHGPTVAVWRFLTSGVAGLALVRRRIPYDIAPGTLFTDLVRDDASH